MNEIQTVKIQGQGYLLNGTMSVPKAEGNREYELIKQWLAEGNTPEPEFTEEEIQVKEAAEAKSKAKRDGLDYNGYQISFMNDDAIAMMQVKSAFDLGVGSTNIHFTNGTVMPITVAEFMDFAIWFVNKRNSFFME